MVTLLLAINALEIGVASWCKNLSEYFPEAHLG
jgi:hypothetical protein